jgi:hypothetical protein
VVTSTESVLIGRPLPDVFAFTADLPGQARRNRDIEAVLQRTEWEFRVGREYRMRFAPFLSDTEGTLTVVEAVPSERVVEHYEFAGLIWMITYTYGAEGSDATRLIGQVEVRPAGMLRLVTPFLARRVKRNNRRSVLALKHVVEAT